MIETIYLELIIILLLSWIFEGKAFPQIIIIFLLISMMVTEIQATIDLNSLIGVLLIAASIIIYSAIQVYTQKGETEI